MNRDEIRDIVFDCIPTSHIHIPRMEMAESLRLVDDLGMDSLDVHELVYDSCDELNIGYDDIDIKNLDRNWKTLGDLVDLFENHLNNY